MNKNIEKRNQFGYKLFIDNSIKIWNNSWALLICILLTITTSCNQEKNGYVPLETLATHPSGMEYVGLNTCSECHADIVSSHMETAHWLTSSIATEETIKGSVEEGKNSAQIKHDIAIKVVQKRNGIYQEAMLGDAKVPYYSIPTHIVIGSGTKGQTYLNWNEDRLYQLQASYFRPTDSWVNSPGYRPTIVEPRPIVGRCLECHTTYAEHPEGYTTKNQFNRETLVYGIDCQRCHGDVVDHVKHHRKYPKDSIGKYIMKYKELNRQQRLDACSLCHSGLRKENEKGIFNFMVGDVLKEFSLPDYDESDLKNLDVHGNQYGLLQASECFKKSDLMDCTTCHNPHKKERGNKMLFNNACINCHDSPQPHITPNGKTLATHNDCVACHMPLNKSQNMKIQVGLDSLVAVEVRTHLIGIYTK